MLRNVLQAMTKRRQEALARAATRAADRILAKLRADATTRRGNVPEGIAVRVSGDSLVIDAPAWVLDKARELGQLTEWQTIVSEEIRAALS